MTAAFTAGVVLLGGCGRTDGTEERAGSGGEVIPPEVVGSWSTDESSTFDPTVYSFYEDGFFTEETGAVRYAGRFEVRDTTLLTFPEEGEPRVHEWRIGDGGCLYLDEVKHCPYS